MVGIGANRTILAPPFHAGPGGRQDRHHAHPPPTHSPRRTAHVAPSPAAERSATASAVSDAIPDVTAEAPSSTRWQDRSMRVQKRQKAPHTVAPTDALAVVCSRMRLFQVLYDQRRGIAVSIGARPGRRDTAGGSWPVPDLGGALGGDAALG